MKISPTAGPQKTTHHSDWCRLCQRYFQEPSTLEAGEPGRAERGCDTNTEVTHVKQSLSGPYIAFPDVIGVFVNISGQAEVADLHDVVLRQENVPSGQVSVDALWAHACIISPAVSCDHASLVWNTRTGKQLWCVKTSWNVAVFVTPLPEDQQEIPHDSQSCQLNVLTGKWWAFVGHLNAACLLEILPAYLLAKQPSLLIHSY